MESSARRDRRAVPDRSPEPVAAQTTPSKETSAWFGKDPQRTVGGSQPITPPLPQPRAAEISGHEQIITDPSSLQLFLNKAMTWITTGNVPVKVGVMISFFGVGFLLKYAIDRELLVLSLEFRLLAVAAAGLALLVIGWRLRKKERVYALSLQGVASVSCS